MWLYPKTKSVGGGFLMSQSYTHAYHSLSPHAFWPQAKFRLLVALGKEDEREREEKKKKKRQQNPCNLFCCYSDTTPLFSALKKKEKENKIACFFFSLPHPPPFSDMHVNSSASVQRVAQTMGEILLEQQLRCSQRVSNRPTICWRILLFSQPASVSFSNERQLQCIVKTIHSSSQRMCHLECSPDPLKPPKLAQAEWTRPMLIQYRIK